MSVKRKLRDVVNAPESGERMNIDSPDSDDCKSITMQSEDQSSGDSAMSASNDQRSPPNKRRRTSGPDTTIDEEKSDMIMTTAVQNLNETLQRPYTPLDPSEDVEFQLVDCDTYNGFIPTLPTSDRDMRKQTPLIRMYGVLEDGSSMCAHIQGFCPYFYVKVWEGYRSCTDCEVFKESLEKALTDDQRKTSLQRYVPKVSEVKKQSIWGYQFGHESVYLKVYVTLPNLVAASRRLLKSGIMIAGAQRSMATYESTLPFMLRFMVDTSTVGMGWIKLNASQYQIVPDALKVSRCSHEVIIGWRDFEAIDKSEIAPLRILSFDIECLCNQGFPEATRSGDKVISISAVVKIQGLDEKLYKTVFCLNTCAPIAGCRVRCFDSERDLLKGFIEFWQELDADVVTGYNIINFDLPYLLDRSGYLKVSEFEYMGRIMSSKTTMRDTSFTSRAYGSSSSKDISIQGRIQLDLLPLIRREHKLRSYSLNNVSFHFLKQQKEDVPHSIIGDLQNGDEQTRRRLAVYCLKDSILPLRLIDSLMILINQIEMARVTGVPMTYLLTRGQQIKVLSQLYRKALVKGLVIPDRDRSQSDNEASFEGAVVIEPIRGYYDSPITTLDFASLYPSIMMAHNLCYTTMLAASDINKMPNEDCYTKTPTGNYFVKSSVQKGLLCEILEELLSARSKAKKEMKAATDVFRKQVLNGRQLALKISANSVYGFTGATVGSLPCLAISASVTGFGRQMIEQTKNIVEQSYPGSQVIYGDTDSVMIKFDGEDMAEAMRLGSEAAQKVSEHFLNPIRLEFEKVYLPYLLMNKKRYAGMLWTKPDKFDYMDAKGIETVRRDNCELVKIVVQKCLDFILIDRTVSAAQDYAKQVISELLQNKIDMSLLVISKALGKIEEYKSKTAHVELVKRMIKRDPATAPKVGDRVAYVIIQGSKHAKAYEKAEDPLYALENEIPLDTEYYLNNQLKQPLTRIFEPILGEKLQSQLFRGKHTRTIKVSTSKAGALSRFTVVKRQCLACKVSLKKGQRSVCDHCKSREAALYVEKMAIVMKHEARFAEMWTQCQRCQGSVTQQVLCSNRDCPIFYRRTKAKKDLDQATELLKHFTL